MCTLERRGNLFYLTLNGSDPEHRLSPALIESILSALRQAVSQSTRGSALITTSTGKFFSNGFDLAWAQSANSKQEAAQRLGHMVSAFKPVVAALLSLPMPTIASINGHAAAAGFMLALGHDYILMRRGKGVLYMSEVDIGLSIPDYFAAMARSRIGSAEARREVFLRGTKVKGEDAVRLGIVDSAHESEEGLAEAATRLGEQLVKRKWNGESYAEIRKSLHPEACSILGLENKVLASPRL